MLVFASILSFARTWSLAVTSRINSAYISGAGDGNRTHIKSLGSSRSTTELHPHSGSRNNKLSHLACLFAQLPRCGKGYIERLCAPCRALNLHKNPAQSWDNLLFPRSYVLILNPMDTQGKYNLKAFSIMLFQFEPLTRLKCENR